MIWGLRQIETQRLRWVDVGPSQGQRPRAMGAATRLTGETEESADKWKGL